MKKNLIVILAMVLIMTHVIPPYNIVLANDEVSECENMDFTVRTIKENNEKISGTGMASDHLTIEFKTKNKTKIVNVDVNSKFELKVDEEFLELNDVILISNDYFKIETKVVSEESSSNSLQSVQYIECPLVEETSGAEEVTEEPDTEEATNSEDVVTEEPETGEPSESEDVAPEEPDTEETTDSEDVATEESGTEETTNSEDVVTEESDTEEASNSEDTVTKKTDTEDRLEESIASDVVKEDSSESDTEDTTEVTETPKKDAEMYSKSKISESKNLLGDQSLPKKDEVKIERFNNLIGNNTRILDISLLSNATLNGEIIGSGEKYRLKLTYKADTVLSLGVLSNIYTYFQLPLDIPIEDVRIIEANYNAPRIGELWRNRGSFSKDNIVKDYSNNAIYTKYSNSISIALASYYIFDLTVELDELPATSDGQYVFQSAGTSGLIDLSILSNDLASLTLNAPVLPQTPSISQPIYSSDEVVSGTGEPNHKIIIRIGNEEYMGETDSEGEFSVTIPPQQEGTVIRAAIESDEGYESDEVSVTVVEPLERPELNPIYSRDSIVTGTGLPDYTVIVTIDNREYRTETDSNGEFSVTIEPQTPGTVIAAKLVEESSGIESPEVDTTVLEGTVSFYNVPPVIMFDNTVIDYTQKNTRIPRENPNWALEVNDTRRVGSNISILAEEVKPLTTSDGVHTLPGSLVYRDSNLNTTPLNEGAEEVFNGTTQEEPIQSFSWEDGQGILIEVNPLTVRPESYSGTINWTISNGP